MAVPKVGALIEVDVHVDPSRAGSIFLVVNKARGRKTVWAKLMACKAPGLAETWHEEGLPEKPICLDFNSDPKNTADRCPGKHEYVKSYEVILNPKAKFDVAGLDMFEFEHQNSIRLEFESINAMLDDEVVDIARSPSPQAT